MTEAIIKAVINYVIPIILGYLIGFIKKLKDKDKKIVEDLDLLKENQLQDMKSDLSNKFYVYDAMEKVEDYLVASFREKCERYFDLGGNTWIHPMYDKSTSWKIKPTGYLK